MTRQQCFNYVSRWLDGGAVDDDKLHSSVELLLQMCKSDHRLLIPLNRRIEALEKQLEEKL